MQVNLCFYIKEHGMIPPLMQYFKLDKGNVMSTLSPKDSQAAINTYGRAQTWDLHLCEILLK